MECSEEEREEEMKRETIERHLREIRDNYRQLPIGVRREKERLEEELAELDAKEASFVDQSGGFTDSDGDRWDFFQHSSGKWIAACIDRKGCPYVVSEDYSECFNPVREALVSWLYAKETGRR